MRKLMMCAVWLLMSQGVGCSGDVEVICEGQLDCENICDGPAVDDSCGVCSGGTTGHVAESDQDCVGICFGEALADDCEVCSGGTSEHVANSDKDCAEVCFGEAVVDGCEVCSGGMSGHVAESDRDCEDLCFGDALVDGCEICSGGTTGHVADAEMDCDGVCDGPNQDCHCDAEAAPFGGGDGSEEAPYLLCSAAQLLNVGMALDAHYRQATDLDLMGVAFRPLDDDSTRMVAGDGFTGSYDGGGHQISNLTYDGGMDTEPVGFFRETEAGSRIVDLTLVGLDISGGNWVGGLVGMARGTTIHRVTVDGAIRGNATVGGLVAEGYNANIANVITRGSVRSQATSSFISSSDDTGAGGIGGLLRGVSRVLRDSESHAEVWWNPEGTHINGWTHTGGAVGYLSGVELVRCHATGDVTGGWRVGGLLGTSESGLVHRDNYATGDVSGITRVGGLVGTSHSPLLRSYATGNVTGTGSYVGGLIGNAWGIDECFATGDVSGATMVGGLAGRSEYSNSVRNSYATGSVTATTSDAGGLLGGSGWCCGVAEGRMMESYSAAPSVTAPLRAAGFMGLRTGPEVFSECFYHANDGVPEDTREGVTAVTDMTVEASFPGFDFATLWVMPTANPRAPGGLLAPVFQWQCGVDGVTCE